MADGGFSNSQEQAILAHYFAGAASPAVAQSSIALCLAAPTDASNVISEPTYTGYARQTIVAAGWVYTAASVDPTSYENNALIQFPLCGEDVAERVTHWALMSSSSGGILLFSGTIVVPSGGLLLNNGVQPQFDVGALRVQLGSVAV